MLLTYSFSVLAINTYTGTHTDDYSHEQNCASTCKKVNQQVMPFCIPLMLEPALMYAVRGAWRHAVERSTPGGAIEADQSHDSLVFLLSPCALGHGTMRMFERVSSLIHGDNVCRYCGGGVHAAQQMLGWRLFKGTATRGISTV